MEVHSGSAVLFCFPILENPVDSPPEKRTGTGFLYDDAFRGHHCPIGSEQGKYECPERLSVCMEKLHAQGLVDRCVQVRTRSITDEEILSLHSPEYLETLKSSSSLSPEELKQLAEGYDDMFMCNRSFELARLAAGGILDLTEKVVKGQLRNGFAVVRPPGHHAQRDCANGYCILNNVALAAKMARTKCDVERVLIVDWDVHHGQGVQYFWEDDPSVLYFSMHRYENQEYWPQLPESNYDHIGRGAGTGYTINIPWNELGMGDSEYLTVFQQLLLPLAYEFNPQLVLVCAGFDAAVGDPQGKMTVTPSCFAHLTHKLMSLAGGKVVLCLEGGYCLQSLGESVACCTSALLGDECPPLLPMQDIRGSANETLNQAIKTLKPHWKSLQCDVTSAKDEDLGQSGDVSSTSPDKQPPKSGGEGDGDPSRDVGVVGDRLQKELRLSRPPHRTGLVFDERMQLHKTFNHVERPDRIARIFTKHQEHGLLERCHRIQARQATEDELALRHLPGMITEIKETSKFSAGKLIEMSDDFNTIKNARSIYLHPETYSSAKFAAGSCLNLVDAVLTNQVLNAVGIVRPPGHHADSTVVAGFCFFNNVAIASKYAQNKYGVKRILIVDWDVHHGNGTQRLLESDPSVMYISLHRYEDGKFYPRGPAGATDKVGKGKGIGFNVNIGWNTGNRGGMGDAEYMAAFHRVIMPLAYQFDPELVFISAGFDAAKGDPLGLCLVSPECYGHMTHMLSSLAGGRVITVLEGGYNLHSIAVSMAMCTRSLLGDALPDLSPGIPSRCGLQTIYDVAKAHEMFWPCMKTLVGNLNAMAYKKVEQTAQPETNPVLSSGSADSDNNSLSSSSLPDTAGEASCIQGALTALDGRVCRTCGLTDVCTISGAHLCMKVRQAFGPEAEIHAVSPLSWCPHLETGVRPLPPTGIDVNIPCQECGGTNENWICLHCYRILCGRYMNEHMLVHGLNVDHLLVLSCADLSVWCYGCEAYIHNEVVIPAKRAAHTSKFGEDVPGI